MSSTNIKIPVEFNKCNRIYLPSNTLICHGTNIHELTSKRLESDFLIINI